MFSTTIILRSILSIFADQVRCNHPAGKNERVDCKINKRVSSSDESTKIGPILPNSKLLKIVFQFKLDDYIQKYSRLRCWFYVSKVW